MAIDEIRVANTNANGSQQQGSPAKPPRPSTDQEPRTQVAQISKTQTNWQMAAQIPDTRNTFRQMYVISQPAHRAGGSAGNRR